MCQRQDSVLVNRDAHEGRKLMHDYHHVGLVSKSLCAIPNILRGLVDHSEGLQFGAGELSSRAATC